MLWGPVEAEQQELFAPTVDAVPQHIQEVMDRSSETLLTFRANDQLRGADGKHSQQVISALGLARYWGLLVEREFGGSQCELRHFLPFLTQAAVIDAPLAGLAAVHGCIGAVDPLQEFGNRSQASTYLPDLATGTRLSAFASTEPGAGSDLRAIQMTAVRTADGFALTGRKAFITNLAPGRTIGMLCKLEGQAAVFVFTLPDQENEHFRFIPNPLHPLKRTHNSGMELSNFPVEAVSLLAPPAGKDGRAIVFHGLNRGRAAICALAAGHLRVILAGMIAWAKQRSVQGRMLADLELIQARCGQIGALIVGCDAMAQWCGSLLDAGYRGELECIIAKVFASEAVKHAAFNLALPTHGGRFFLQGHASGDMAYDYLAPCIYEGENDLLRLALVHNLAKSPPRNFGRAGRLRIIREQLKAGKLRQPEMIAVSRRIESIVVSTVAQSALAAQPVELRPAYHLLHKLLFSNSFSADHAAEEIDLGRQVIEHDLFRLGDAPAFADPLCRE